MQDVGIARTTIALFMLVAVLGGLAFQVPVGRLSDRFDRRIVLAALGLGFAGAAVALVLLPRSLPVVLPAAALLGGFMSTLYPICVAHAHDRMPADRVVAVSGRLILVSGSARWLARSSAQASWRASTSTVCSTLVQYDAKTNPTGIGCDLYDHLVNVFGRDPATGFARRPIDNIGVQYGLEALNLGAITKQQFLALNRNIGGYV
jgi:hypothetical protein